MTSSPALSAADREQLAALGIAESELARQLACFARGFDALDVVGPATLEQGIEVVTPGDRARLHALWQTAARDGRLAKFVPASGAASRMFQVFEARRALDAPLTADEIARARASERATDRDLARFFDEFDRFAFAPLLRAELRRRGFDDVQVLRGEDRRPVLDAMLAPDGLGFAALPKGLIPFHRTGERARTAFEEHLDEAQEVVRDDSGRCRVHFTVAPDSRARIEAHCAASSTQVELGFSEQGAHTDTIAVDLDDRPLRDAHGRLVFRPGGHGALIGNLDALAADIVFVKNIDNIVPAARRVVVVEYQRLLAGVLIERQQQAHAHWHRLQSDAAAVTAALDFVQHALHRTPPDRVRNASPAEQRDWLLDVLARPLRVCGMVRNQGEPGGGPFRVRAKDGGVSLQIVESVQIDRTDQQQEAHLRASTHFNPVDLVCALRGPRGEQLPLDRFVDPDAGFIAKKSKDGTELKALERPGLWNGAMAHWNTVFVEVPVETFNPVKTVIDLLRPAHQGG